ncbi:MBL fold metallo-hydrolase [Streptomyces sp. NPDC059506]|uniref:MBL fold metallo-hydrolase n=1 Tax=Streptomyces TaxID=1883 RepID=UPI000CA8AED4|nr:MBL fold metallo-hydrolase [Streptomyces sp. HB2AG]MCZ2526168.1 MBL fold metallo-hydrolase [Streptomyces sp. HB2AG]PLW71953.1 MBL fold metallo-hydrolase [Streptomyces sp. DJ]
MTLSLKKNVIAEPAVAGWYAWSYLIPPQTLAKYLKNHYRNIVESYLADPETHRTALKQARFQGGPFVHEQEGSYDRIRLWYEAARERQAPLLELADAVDELEQKILPAQTGASMEQVYKQLPEPLAGRVELFYNRDNRTPDYRFIEPFLYASPYFDRALQQVRFSEIHRDAREFALTTPVLEYTPEQVLVDLPLDSELLDTVFRGGLAPEELDRVVADLGLAGERAATFRGFFEEDREAAPGPRDGGEDVVEYVGHACVFVRHRGTTFLVDPVVSYSGYSRESDGRFTFDDLPERIDYVMITHNHQDHMLLETLLRIRHRVGRVVIAKSANSSLVDPDLKRILTLLGFRDVVELDDLETLGTPGGTITAVPFLGEHGDIRIRTKCGWMLDLDGTRVLFAADSTNVSPQLYPLVTAALGRVHTVFIGMESVGAPVSWLYGPLFPEKLERRTDAGRRLRGSNFEQAAAIVDALGADSVYVYAMGQEPWLGAVMCVEYDETHPAMIDSDRLVAYVRERGGTAKRLFLHESMAVRP